MECGISTACFYPQETKEALAVLQRAHVGRVELFLNSYCELENSYLLALERQLQASPLEIVALHPFTCAMEPFFFATQYEARLWDGLRFYERYFEACERLKIPLFIFHGDFTQNVFPFAQHCENFARLRDLGRSYGIEVCQENVVRCKCGFVENLQTMRKLLKDDVSFVLDIKQMRRAGVTNQEMLTAMGGCIRHLHLSDANAVTDCAVPGQGSFDFSTFFKELQALQAIPTSVIELYRGDFTDLPALKAGAQYINTILAQV